MANRTGTYVAFDGLGQTDPTKSDFKYYATLQMWSANRRIDFKFVNSHEKTDAVRDTSKLATLKARVQERLHASKNMIVIITTQTRKSGSVLAYEIEQAVDYYELPLIIVYPGFRVVGSVYAMSALWPTALNSRIEDATARAIHIAFAKEPILAAISDFGVNCGHLTGPNFIYPPEAYRHWELLRASEQQGTNLHG